MTIFTHIVCEHVPSVGMGEGKDGGAVEEESVSSCKLQHFKGLEQFFFSVLHNNVKGFGYLQLNSIINPCPAEPGYTLRLQTV